MTVRPIHASFLAAHFNAGIVVAGAQYGLPVYRISIIVKNCRRERPSLMKFSDFLKANAARGAHGPGPSTAHA